MKKIQLSIKNHYMSENYVPYFNAYDEIHEIDFECEDDIENLYKNINLYVHTYYTYTNNIRNGKFFESASAIFLDFDNKTHHNDSNVDDFLSSDFAKKYNWFLYTSKSHIPDTCECYHVALPLDEPIKNLKDLRATYDDVFLELKKYGLVCDFQVRDGARLVYPSMMTDNHFDTFRFEFNHMGDYLELTEHTEEVIDEEITHTDATPSLDIYSIDNKYLNVFYTMSKKSRYNYVKSVLTFMNRYNRSTGFKHMTYHKWIGIGFTLHQVFGYTNGLKLFKILSAGHPTDTPKKVESQFSRLVGDVNGVDENILSLIKMSTSMGFRHKMYFRYYFMSKHSYRMRDSLEIYYKIMKKVVDGFDYECDYRKVKMYNFSHKKYTRKFLLVFPTGEHEVISMSKLIDISADIFGLDREFITTAITHGVIRRHVKINGVFNLHEHIKGEIYKLLVGDEFVRVDDINIILKKIRGYAPTTIQSSITTKYIEECMFNLGAFVEKKKVRFKTLLNKPYMAYKICKRAITPLKVKKTKTEVNHVDFSTRLYGFPSVDISNNVVMKC